MKNQKHIANDVNSIEEFLEKYMRHQRYQDLGEEYKQAVLTGHEEDVMKYGNTLISRHESVTGEAVWYYAHWASRSDL